jgi:hypothetical protein
VATEDICDDQICGKAVMMRVFQILSAAAAVASFIAGVIIGGSIANDVNEKLGTDYNGVWSWGGNKIWKEHERLFPASPKRTILAAVWLAAFGLLMAAAFFTR